MFMQCAVAARLVGSAALRFASSHSGGAAAAVWQSTAAAHHHRSAAAPYSTTAAAAAEPLVLVARHPNHAVVTLNRPKALNALSADLGAALLEAVQSLDADPAVGAIVITGAGRAFAAGADIKQLATYAIPDEARAAAPFAALDAVSSAAASTPLIAAVNGFALGGGCELAMLCDIVVAGDAAVFGLPEVALGVLPALGGTQRLPRLVGRALAMDVVLTGRRLSAAEALAAGLASRVVQGDPLPEARSIAERIATGAPRGAIARARAAVRAADALPLPAGLARERALFYACYGPEQAEGMAAFLARRPPNFAAASAAAAAAAEAAAAAAGGEGGEPLPP